MGESGILLLIFLLLLGAILAVSIVLIRKAERERDEALQHVADARTDFLSRISNDIKTPMNVIMGMTAVGLEESDHPEKMVECLGKIDTASRFLMGLLNDLVDVSMIELGRFRLHPKPYALEDFMEAIRDMTEPECAKKGITFYMSGGENNLNVMVDPIRLEQLFFNLLGNAVKFTPEGGEISFRVCNYAVHSGTFSADYVVADTGIGMSREFQKLFEPFTQERRDEAERRHGSGLGLAITQNIVQQLGGSIAVTSAIGEGTKVKVHLDLPLADIQPQKEVARGGGSRQAFAALEGKRVLLAEDHPLNVEITRKLLERRGVEVVCAEDGRQALELFMEREEHYFDAILMDIVMPKMDGFEAARQIRRVPHKDAQMIPIIAMSAKDAREDMDACKEAGMNDYLAKPVEPQRLYQVLAEYLENPM
jgi:CheY-like chemotaxis protein